jgi:hypothetical protein
MSVSVLPASSALGGLASTFPTVGSGKASRRRHAHPGLTASCSVPGMQNGAVPRSHDEMSVQEIKERAKGHAQRATRGASALHLIRAARSQLALAHSHERDGDLKAAYSAYIKSVSLIQTCMDAAEFKVESQPGKHGVLWKEYQEYTLVGTPT